MKSEPNASTPTEVISAWIPHDARWHEQARVAAVVGEAPLCEYVTGLVVHRRNGETPLTTEYDLRTIAAVREDLGPGLLTPVDWYQVRSALLPPLRISGRV